MLAELIHDLIAFQEERGRPPIVEMCWHELAHEFKHEDELLRFGKKNGLAFVLIVTKLWRKCFAMRS